MCHLSVKRLLLPKSFQIIILAFFLHQNHNICSEKGIFERIVNAKKKKLQQKVVWGNLRE
jgi:hypothetical protein